MTDDGQKVRLRLPSAARLRGLLHKSPLSFLGSIKNPEDEQQFPASFSGRTTTFADDRSYLSVPVNTRSRAVSNASENSFATLSRWASQSSLSIGLKTTWDAFGMAKDRVLGETESGVAFNDESDVEEDKSNQLDPAKWLPSELMILIMSHLDHVSAISSMRVSKRWHELASMNMVWRELYFKYDVNWNVVDELPVGVSWRRLFETRYLLDQRWYGSCIDPKVLVGHNDSVYCVQFDDLKVVTGSRDRTIRVWNAKSGQLTKTLGISIEDQIERNNQCDTIYHTGSVLCLSYDDEIMISGSSDSSCIIWDMAKLKPLQQVYRHSAGVLDVCLDKDHIVSCSKDSTLCVWDRKDPKYGLKWRLHGHRGPVNAVQLQGDYIVSAGGDAIVKLWSVSLGKCIREFQGHTRGLACVQLCVKSRRIVSGSNDTTMRVWDLDTGQCLHVLDGHKALVRSVYVFNDRIISGSYDQTIKVWNLYTGELISDIDGLHGSWIFSAKADAKRIITTSIGVKPVIMNFGKGLDQQYLDYIR